MEELDRIIDLATQMHARRSLEELLQLVVEGAAALLGVERVSVRLLDPDRRRLIAIARAGRPLHEHPVEFVVGEGLMGWIVQHDRPIRVEDAEADARFAGRAGMSGPMGGFLGVPIRAGAHCIGVLSAIDVTVRFDARQQQLLELVAAMSGPHLEIARLSRLSRVDPLTGSLNRRGLDDAFPEVDVRDGEEGVAPLCVVMLDIDHFKQVNDEHGHAAGDVVLRQVASIAARVVRGGDAVIRYGGEEFLLVLPRASLSQAVRVAERVRQAIAAQPIQAGPRGISITVSLGVAERRGGESRDGVIARADAALYRAKHAGRDRVVTAG